MINPQSIRHYTVADNIKLYHTNNQPALLESPECYNFSVIPSVVAEL